MNKLNDFQQRMHGLLIEYATNVYITRKGTHASSKTAQDYTESMERYLPKEAAERFGITDFPETAYDILDIQELQSICDLIENKPEWKHYDAHSHGSTFRGGLRCLIELKTNVEFLKNKGLDKELLCYKTYGLEVKRLEKEIKDGKSYVSHCTGYERNPVLRLLCLNYYGYKCQACGFDFEAKYGELGRGFIEVHHLDPLSNLKREHVVDPISGLIPLCSNCHSIIHRMTPPLTPKELINKLK